MQLAKRFKIHLYKIPTQTTVALGTQAPLIYGLLKIIATPNKEREGEFSVHPLFLEKL